MRCWRTFVAVLLAGLIGVPVAAPFVTLLVDPGAWSVWSEVGRLLALGRNTLLLVGGTLCLSLPLGSALAVLCYRTDMAGGTALRFFLLLGLFVPLPLVASGWQAALSFLPALPSWAPWQVGIGSAVWLHTAAALPWVVVLVGQGLRSVERELEEEALTAAGPMRVLLLVTLPRAVAAVAAAGLWIVVMTAGEITITDVMQIRTLAEEVYTQFVAPEGGHGDAVARALAVALPWALALAGLVAMTAIWWERSLAAGDQAITPRPFFLGRWRWPATVGCSLFTGFLLGIPVIGLLRRAGQGRGGDWSALELGQQLIHAAQVDRGLLASSLLTAGAAGLVTASLALCLCWTLRGTRFYLGVNLALLAVALALPGPVLGLGLKNAIAGLCNLTDWRWPADLLYYGPSPGPLLWVDLVRFLPLAVALLWPVVRLVPPELLDAARVDGATPWREFTWVVWPLTRSAWGRACLAVAILSLGELSAGKLVATPGWPGYAHELFARMHYGVTPDLAAGCLLLLAVVALLAGSGLAMGACPKRAQD